MKKSMLYLLPGLLLLSCGQHHSVKQQNAGNDIPAGNKEAGIQLAIDTNHISILSATGVHFFSLNDSTPALLSNADIQATEMLLQKSISAHNAGKDSTQLYGEYINPKKYNRQYVAYINAKAEKKVFINCFCSGMTDLFPAWKTKLLDNGDGGNCFFNVTVDLTTQTFGSLLFNE